MPQGVDGAYKLFANLLSVGKRRSAGHARDPGADAGLRPDAVDAACRIFSAVN
jgi:hypothetical protein